MIRSFLLVALFSGALPLLAAGPQPNSYDLDVVLKPDMSLLEATASLDFEEDLTHQQLTFFLHGELQVESIEAANGEIDFEVETVFFEADYSLVARRVTFTPPPSAGQQLTIHWSGYFHPSRARSPSDYMRIETNEVLLRSYYYSLWFPVFVESSREEPEPASFRARFTTPENLTAVFVGNVTSRSQGPKGRVSTWETRRIPIFTAQLTARPYTVHGRESFFAYSQHDEESRRAAEAILNLATTLDRKYRELYDQGATSNQLHVLQMPQYGDIASGNMIGVSVETWKTAAESEHAQRTIAHELVHAYVSPKIDNTDPLWALVIEGFPSYFHLPVLEEAGWKNTYDDHLDRIEASYLEKRRTRETRRGRPLPPEIPIDQIGPDEIGHYKDRFVLSDRALLFLDACRRAAGETAFGHLAHRITNQESLDTESLKALILQMVPEMELDLDTWLSTTEFPDRFHRSVSVAPEKNPSD